MNEAERREFLALSDERDAWEARIQSAERAAFQRGQDAAFSRGYATAIEDVKRSQHELVTATGIAASRMVPSGEAWRDAVERNGGTEYGGKDRPRVPVDPHLWQRDAQRQDKEAGEL